MKVLVIGGGGREHALVWKLAQSPKVSHVYCAPGNAGIAQMAECVPLDVNDFAALAEFAKREHIGLTVVGPEDPLLNGIVDFFEEQGLAIFGPKKEAALLEGSKTFAKDIMEKYHIPTGAYRSFTEYDEALAYVREQGAPIVIKADGLAAGKGVTVAFTMEEAEEALRSMMVDDVFSGAGSRVVIEEYLVGEEMTLLSFVDGETVIPMVPSQDHKPVFNDDKGPNTGGMGTYSPVPHMDDSVVQQAIDTIVLPTARAMVAEGRPFRGILYTGLMITEKGPKVIEYNARFGDPETQVVLPRLASDLADIFLAAVEGRLSECQVEWKDGAAVCVVMSSEGYPGSYPKGREIAGLLANTDDVVVFHAGTAEQDGHIVTNGGRVLGVTAMGYDLYEAQRRAYETVRHISFEGAHYRTDIGAKALRKAEHNKR
ncbi:phosphoribosylamine--glycine ligase [Aneurinibacillus aneurinilyticus]|uniref:Phosphoribosylamine--glycine ligase n=1 Tax=Aneurinibacillus aneurinilyticus ATCC 12856 TaxID=649747 RepID=U1X2B5_ANEAE|nr:phosphoribosylamine--glycine ligase [Aneurinibacillus aneurinilyticus]ERI08678.1 phosphoribosylamine--glycine ligase [Aneurinibacillus aneurinilyticus ATCC 12856]MED0708473.1 phosphoribosylamine--glycine ligase [Aneurinibacillus aneurinilyticus]MED0723207.1 phosphoribosylamine--glycine ligase [Aneurinibacillus aneurinilyticus]MED0732970.1 phosphoribosylamine--glycine ligase [Aneurinibacillus aneurinilyticus]MED0739591.1 phosphoribosylamine--glycine ligase [Aneurinibacillus aneurinilyticus]